MPGQPEMVLAMEPWRPVSLPRHPFPLQWSSPPASKHDPSKQEKKHPTRNASRGSRGQHCTELGAAAGPCISRLTFSQGPAGRCWQGTGQRAAGNFHSMQWKWKWHFCNLHHVTSVNALPLDHLPPSSPPSCPRPMGISTAVDRETLHESRRAVTAASRRVPSPTLDASEQFTWTTTLDTRRRANLTRHKAADEPASTCVAVD